MKKYASSILVLFIAVAFMASFYGCQKLSPSNLKASYNLKKANGLYAEEKFRKAIEYYEEALELNPELKSIYVYLGTSYSSVYKPGRDDERNQEYASKAIEYLTKAKAEFPEDENISLALSDIYDKKGDFEEAEKYYLEMRDKDTKKPQTYYILADFYSKYGKTDKATDMYEQRIELDPLSPDGYHYYGNYAAGRRDWNLSIASHEKRILAVLAPDLLTLKLEADKLKKDQEQIEAIKKNMDMIKKNKHVDKTEKERLIGEAEEKLAKFKPEEEIATTVADNEKKVEDGLKGADSLIEALDDEGKTKLAEAYYTLGVVCWNKSYQTPPHLMAPPERIETCRKGLDALDFTLKLQPENHQAFAFIGLVWRQMIIAEPLKNDEYMANWQKAMDKSKELREKQVRREQLQKQLESMGKAE